VGIGVLWVIQGPLNLHEETSSLTGKSSDSRVAPLLRIQTEKVRDDALPSKRRSYRSRSAAPVAPFLKSGNRRVITHWVIPCNALTRHNKKGGQRSWREVELTTACLIYSQLAEVVAFPAQRHCVLGEEDIVAIRPPSQNFRNDWKSYTTCSQDCSHASPRLTYMQQGD